MRLSKAYWQTIKEVPSDAEIISHQLLIRAGLIAKTTSGIYSYLPFALRSLQKIQNIIRDELNTIGAQEVLLSFVTPGSLWKESGRWESMGPEMVRLKDRKNTDFCLSATNEETITDIIGKSITSYKQLPINLYQINTKYRDEIRPRFGLMRCREFIMKDGYTFHIDKESMEKSYQEYFNAYHEIFKKIGLDFVAVEADGGAMADKDAKTHEFQVIADNGEDTLVEIPDEKIAINIEKSHTKRNNLSFLKDEKVQKVLTQNLKTCEKVAKLLEIEVHQTLKSLIYKVNDTFYHLVLLGDDDLNELKANAFLNGKGRFASDNEIKELGLVKGYIGPNNSKLDIVFDDQIDLDASYTIGANEEDYHQRGFTPSKEIKNIKTASLRLTKESDVSIKGSLIKFRRGIEVGHIFQLGDKYTKSMKKTVLDNSGKKINPLMGCYGIGVSRVLAAAIEQCHDENGIIWPYNIAPYQIHFAVIAKSDDAKESCEQIYQNLVSNKFEVLMDDRGLGFGGMLKDADLLGLPIRVLFGERDFKESGELEICIRKSGEKIKVTPEKLIQKLNEIKVSL